MPEEASPPCEDPNHDHAHERGATTIEYGLLIAFIGTVVALALGPFGPAIASLYDDALAAF